jgi:hypothetical protein
VAEGGEGGAIEERGVGGVVLFEGVVELEGVLGAWVSWPSVVA